MTLTQFLGDTEVHTIPMRWRGRAFVPGTAWVLKFTVKALSSQTDALRLLQKGYPAFGVTVSGCNAVVTILREDTFRTAPPFEAAEGKYVWDIQAQQVAAPNHTRTVASGTFVLERDVTRLSDFTGPIYTTENPLTLVIGPAGATETTASILTKLAQGTGGAGEIGAQYLPDALSGAGVPSAGAFAKATITITGFPVQGNYVEVNGFRITWKNSPIGNRETLVTSPSFPPAEATALKNKYNALSGEVPGFTATSAGSLVTLTATQIGIAANAFQIISSGPFNVSFFAEGANATASASYIGQPYRNTTANEWYRWNGTAWQGDASSITQFNIDGGTPGSVFGGTIGIDGGTP